MKKKDKVKFDIIPKTNQEYISVTYGCIRFIDTYRFFSSSLDSLVKRLVDSSQKSPKKLKREIVDNDEKSKFVNEIGEEDRTIEDFETHYPDKFKKLEEALNNYISENDLKCLKMEFSDKWKELSKKLTYPYQYFISIDYHQKPFVNLRKKRFLL